MLLVYVQHHMHAIMLLDSLQLEKYSFKRFDLLTKLLFFICSLCLHYLNNNSFNLRPLLRDARFKCGARIVYFCVTIFVFGISNSIRFWFSWIFMVYHPLWFWLSVCKSRTESYDLNQRKNHTHTHTHTHTALLQPLSISIRFTHPMVLSLTLSATISRRPNTKLNEWDCMNEWIHLERMSSAGILHWALTGMFSVCCH